MKISQKRTCNGCQMSVPGSALECELNYKTRSKYYSPGIVIEAIPLEPCPKPRTRAEWFETRTNMDKWGAG